MTNKEQNKIYLGIILVVTAFLLGAIRSAFSKILLQEGIPAQVILFFQTIIALLFLLPWILKNGTKNLVIGNLKQFTVRSVSGFAAIICFIISLKYTTLAKAVLLNNTSPLFLPILAIFVFRKKLKTRLLFTLAVGFLGIIMILKPETGAINRGDMLAFLSGALAAVSIVFIRLLQKEKDQNTQSIIFYYLIFIIICSGLLSIKDWIIPHNRILWIFLLIMGATYSLFQISFTTAFVHAPTSKISPFIYFGVIFAGLIDWAVWKNAPDLLSAAGMIIVIISAILSVIFTEKTPS
ncbi:MAG: DMT family transporter [Candidatus Aureabacteria bacterium]|nr:DMT family transporter [Candidatus Auribacterota bacterium]